MQSGTYLNLHDQFLFISLNSLKIKVIWNISKSISIKIATNSCPFYFHVLGDHKGSIQTGSKDLDMLFKRVAHCKMTMKGKKHQC